MTSFISEDENSFVGLKEKGNAVETEGWLSIKDSEIKKRAPSFFSFLKAHWLQIRREKNYKKNGVDFRRTSPDEVRSAYGAMDDHGFDEINARQAWANWRTIPRSMSLNVPQKSVSILDLGCGAGTSTEILAWYLPEKSSILAMDLTPELLELAKKRNFRTKSGNSIRVDFVLQSVTDPYKDSNGNLLLNESIDYVNTSGVVGHHLEVEQLKLFAKEVHRVLRRGARAAVDCGPHLQQFDIVPVMEKAGFRFLKRTKSFFIDPRGQIVFEKI